MYKHFIIRKLKNYSKFCELKSARMSELALLTAALLKSEGEKRDELERLLDDKRERYTQNEKERKHIEIYLQHLDVRDRELLTDFYIKRKRDRYSRYYDIYGDDLWGVKNQALENLSEIYFKTGRKKRNGTQK